MTLCQTLPPLQCTFYCRQLHGTVGSYHSNTAGGCQTCDSTIKSPQSISFQCMRLWIVVSYSKLQNVIFNQELLDIFYQLFRSMLIMLNMLVSHSILLWRAMLSDRHWSVKSKLFLQQLANNIIDPHCNHPTNILSMDDHCKVIKQVLLANLSYWKDLLLSWTICEKMMTHIA